MNTFIRLTDNREMTEREIDPLIDIPSIHFNPSKDVYIMVRQWAKPAIDEVTQEVVKAPSALIEGIWTQQWAIIEKPSDIIDALNAQTKET